MTENLCGSCTFCCMAMGIAELEKPAGPWCEHCDKGVGCKIYEDRPESCRTYECLWLQWKKNPDSPDPPDFMRPDRAKIVLSPTTNENVVGGTVDPKMPDAWKKDRVEQYIGQIVTGANVRMVIGPPNSREKIEISNAGGIAVRRKVTLSEPDERGMQWYVPTEDGSKFNALRKK